MGHLANRQGWMSLLIATVLFLLVGFSDRLPAFRDSFGIELQPHGAGPLLHETESHQLSVQHRHHEPACGGCAGESSSIISY